MKRLQRKLIRGLREKTHIRIPYGEIQYGHITGSIVIWFRGKKYHPWTSKKMKKFKRTGEL